MTILRTPDQIADAPTSDLLETYNAMLGKDVKKFSSRAAAERLTEMAMLSAQDATGHLGVPPNTKRVTPKTAKERGEKPEAEPAPMFKQLIEAGKNAAPPPAPRTPRTTIELVALAPGEPTASLRPNSERSAVYIEVQRIAAKGKPVAVAALEEALRSTVAGSIRGHLQKLLASSHIVRVEAP